MSLRIGIIGTGAIANMHARAYKNIGYTVRVCTNVTAGKGTRVRGRARRRVRRAVRRRVPPSGGRLSSMSARFPRSGSTSSARAPASRKPVQVQKPMSTTLDAAREMIEIARDAGIVLGVVSQHRFDRASLFLSSAIRAGRLGKLLQCDAYVKW